MLKQRHDLNFDPTSVIGDSVFSKFSEKKVETSVVEKAAKETIKVANLSDLKKRGYESVGTGYYKDAEHHLWRVQKEGDSYSLLRAADEEGNSYEKKEEGSDDVVSVSASKKRGSDREYGSFQEDEESFEEYVHRIKNQAIDSFNAAGDPPSENDLLREVIFLMDYKTFPPGEIDSETITRIKDILFGKKSSIGKKSDTFKDSDEWYKEALSEFKDIYPGFDDIGDENIEIAGNGDVYVHAGGAYPQHFKKVVTPFSLWKGRSASKKIVSALLKRAGLTLNVVDKEGEDHYDQVLSLLKSKFKNQEDFESRLDEYGEEVAKELGATFEHTDKDELIFNFTPHKKVKSPFTSGRKKAFVTREELLKEFTVDEQGLITNPGKFEGDMLYVPYFYDVMMEGGAEHEGEMWMGSVITDEDRKEFPDDLSSEDYGIIIEISDSGFVYGTVLPKEDFDSFVEGTEAGDYQEASKKTSDLEMSFEKYWNDSGYENRKEMLERMPDMMGNPASLAGMVYADLPVGLRKQLEKYDSGVKKASKKTAHKFKTYSGYVDFEKKENGLIIRLASDFDKEELKKDLDIKVSSDLEFEILEDALANGWEFIQPEQIGAMTEAPMITDSVEYIEEGEYPDNIIVPYVYVYDNYQIKSWVEELLEDGEVFWPKYDGDVKKASKKTSLKKWESPKDYVGEDYPDYYVGPSITRDSNTMEKNNFEVALEMLGGEQGESVMVVRFRHWAVGWVDAILVHQGDAKAVAELQEIEDILSESSVLDEEAFDESIEEDINSWARSEAIDMLGLEDKEIELVDADGRSMDDNSFRNILQVVLTNDDDLDKDELSHQWEYNSIGKGEKEVKELEDAGQMRLPGVANKKKTSAREGKRNIKKTSESLFTENLRKRKPKALALRRNFINIFQDLSVF